MRICTPSLPFNDLRGDYCGVFDAVRWCSVPSLFFDLFPVRESQHSPVRGGVDMPNRSSYRDGGGMINRFSRM